MLARRAARFLLLSSSHAHSHLRRQITDPAAASAFCFRAMATATAPPHATATGAAPTASAANGADARQAFIAVYDKLRDELVNDGLLGEQPAFAKAYVKEMLDFNVPGGKLNRGMAVADALAAHTKTPGGAAGLAPDAKFAADALGWCIEWLQAFFLVADDIMDNSVTRRGQPCWYRMPHVGMVACNDYIILDTMLYRILQMHFRSHPAYADLVDLFHETTYQTAHGQMLDVKTAPIGTVDLNKYTLDNYNRIVTYKTAFYSFYLPIACGLILAGAPPAAREAAKEICLEMGRYFQVQDDYLDAFGDPAAIGKVGTDIQDNKCSWLVCTALAAATPAQRAVIEANYGKEDEAAVAAVKALYREMDLEAKFKAYEAESYAKLTRAIEAQVDVPAGVFTAMLAKIYKRQK